jgi:hypothetical protein
VSPPEDLAQHVEIRDIGEEVVMVGEDDPATQLHTAQDTVLEEEIEKLTTSRRVAHMRLMLVAGGGQEVVRCILARMRWGVRRQSAGAALFDELGAALGAKFPVLVHAGTFSRLYNHFCIHKGL